MSRILILYSTTDGHTVKISDRLRQVLEQQAHRVEVVSIADSQELDLCAFDKIVIGASIRYGKHHPRVFDFIDKNRAFLESRPSAFFSVNIVARKPGKDSPAGNPYLQKFLRRSAWRPKTLAVFAGKLDYPRYSWLDRRMIQLIMLITRGPTDPRAVIEFTDWAQVEDFGRRVGAMPD
jgi:menaquinone-dependent protoporphyrinogen oxidase